jgi:hypothetical protein
MVIPDFELARGRLLEGGDTEVAKVARILDAVFRSSKFRPANETLSQERELIDAVRTTFPTPFARKFAGWVDLNDELQVSIDQFEAATDASRRERLEQRARLRFRNALLEIETCWRQIVHLMPFILMATLRRLSDDVLRQYAGEELAQALHYYNTFYGRYDTERQREADQLHLLVYLVRVFRKLRRSAGLDETALFAIAVGRTETGFVDLFPDRFDASMRLLQQIRNRVIHGRVADRISATSLADVIALVNWCFLDVVAVLKPICEAYSLNYVVDLSIRDNEAEAETLDFVGGDGPEHARYRVSLEPRIEILAFTRQRLYLILRAKRIGGGSGGVLEPRDYLDLTPFMITDRLRQVRADPRAAERQLLFALQQYLEPVRRLLFSDLGGTGDNPRPTDTNDWEANRLLDQIQWFKDRIGQLTAKIRVKTAAPIEAQSLRALLWRVSREPLGPLLDVRLYDEAGAIRPDAEKHDLRTVYDHELFVEPREGADVVRFLASGQRGLLLVGGSGFGKSNLLIHYYLQSIQARRLGVFLAARRFATPDFPTAILHGVAREISHDWGSLDQLDGFLEETGETLLIVIDAINEYSGPRGPLALLASMIGAVNRDRTLRRCKIIATCRSETWARFRQEYGDERPLDPDVFATHDGDAIRVGGFDNPERGRMLFESYSRFYDLVSRPYQSLGATPRALLAQPFMMAIVAETYSNRGRSPNGPPRVSLPSDFDYFSIFERLTERKGRDAKTLVPTDERLRREMLPGELKAFCKSLAEIIYEHLMSAEGSLPGSDAVPLDVIDKRANLQPFVQRRGPISVLDAALQIGVVEQIRVQQRDSEGRLADNTALAFFHDQYSQYWLAAAYQDPILGWLDAKRLATPGEIEVLAGRIRHIVERSAYAPILAGALDHWLQKNLENFHGRKLEPLLPLLDRLANDTSAAVRFQVVQSLASLMLRGFLSPREVFEPAMRVGSESLRLELVNMYVEFWPALPPNSVQALIDACDPDRDQAVLDKLGDIFVLHLPQDPALVVDYLDQAIRPLSWTAIAEPMRLYRQSRFMQQFGIFGFILSFDQPDRIDALRRFFRAKYRPAIELITGGDTGSGLKQAAFRSLRGILFRRSENFGVDQWNRFIVYMAESGNDLFFEYNQGVNQHDLLRELLPYVVDIHNGDFTRLSLAPGTPFRTLLIRMIDFRVMSVIGYNALLCLPSVLLREPWAVTEAFVMELIERRSDATVFYGNLLLANLAYTDVHLAESCMVLMRDRIVPLLLKERLRCDWSIAFCIATLDVATLWPLQSAILDQLFAALEARDDDAEFAAFCSLVFKICYTHEIDLGRRMLEKLLADPERFLARRWRPVTLKVFAAMLTRNPATLYAAIRGAGASESLVSEARDSRTPDVVEQSRLFPLQADINRFVAWLYIKEPRLRYSVVKHFIGGLACGRSVGDFAVGVRQLVVTIMSVFLGDAPDRVPQGPLTTAEIAASVAASRRERERRRTPGS